MGAESVMGCLIFWRASIRSDRAFAESGDTGLLLLSGKVTLSGSRPTCGWITDGSDKPVFFSRA